MQLQPAYGEIGSFPKLGVNKNLWNHHRTSKEELNNWGCFHVHIEYDLGPSASPVPRLKKKSRQGVFLKKVKFLEVCQIKSLRVDISWVWLGVWLEAHLSHQEKTWRNSCSLVGVKRQHYRNTQHYKTIQNICIHLCFFQVGRFNR